MITIAADHKAAALMQDVQLYLHARGLEVENVGSLSEDEPALLQAIIPHVVKQVQRGEAEFGILACGSGTGVEIGANRFRGIRAALCVLPQQASFARNKDNANVLCLSSYVESDVHTILDAWLSTQFDGDERRSQMLQDFDAWQ